MDRGLPRKMTGVTFTSFFLEGSLLVKNHDRSNENEVAYVILEHRA
jgi:hypothetical protein